MLLAVPATTDGELAGAFTPVVGQGMAAVDGAVPSILMDCLWQP